MKFGQAGAYFVREAALNMARGWRVTLLAVLTIAVSLFVGGIFLLVSANLSRAVAAWRASSTNAWRPWWPAVSCGRWSSAGISPMPSTRNWRTLMSRPGLRIAACLLALAPLFAVATQVQVVGLFPGAAVINVDGQRKLVKVGQTGPGGVQVISADSKGAVLRVEAI